MTIPPYDLRFELWIPFRRASGSVEWLPPYGVTDGLTSDPIVAIATPRADFDAAVLEFLIGLFSIALKPDDESEWQSLWRAPPSPAVLRDALERLPQAFYLAGDGPRIFQDLDPLNDVEETPIEGLLITAAGEQSRKNNTDLFIKRDHVLALGRPAAAMALLTMQTFAPAGGQGHRTSLRGGGPLATLSEPRSAPGVGPLWFLVWANGETIAQADKRDGDPARLWGPGDIFPWLACTRTSNSKAGGGPTRTADASPWQAYFGLPRRIRLTLHDTPGVCGLTGAPDEVTVTGFRMKNYGVQYVGWQHPLTPYYWDKNAGLLPVHGQPSGVGWRDWQGLLLDDPDGTGTRPAQAIAQFRARRSSGRFRLLVAGYDCDNMKARSWVQAELPAVPEAVVDAVSTFSKPATAGAELVAKAVMFAVKEALLQRPKDAPGDFSYLKQALWNATQRQFFVHVGELVADSSIDGPTLREAFRQELRAAALHVFDTACPIEVSLNPSHMRRPISARHRLVMSLEGYGKAGAALFKAMNLAPRETERKKRGEMA